MFRTVLVTSFLLFTSSALSSEWPTYRGSLSRAGWTAETLTTPLNLQWTHSAPSQPRKAWPGPGGKTIEGLHLRHRVRFDDVFDAVIVDGNVYYGSSVENCVDSVDLRTGQRRWRFYTDGPVRLAPMHADGRLFFGSDDGHAYCLDIESGSLNWKRRAGPRDERILARGRMSSRWPVRTGVLVDNNVAYFGAGTFPHETVYVCAVQADNGEVIWCNDSVSQQDAGRNDLSPQGHLLATEDLLFVSSGRTLPAAFDRKTGEFVHKQLGGGKQVGGSSALLIDDLLYTMGEHEIVVLDQSTGEHEYRLPGRQIVVAGDTAYVTNQGELQAVDHKKYAACYSNSETRKEFAERKNELLRHPYLQTQRQIKDVQAKLEIPEADSAQLKQELASLEGELRQHSEDYNSKRLETESMIGVKWRARCSLDSALILCGNRLIVGGVGEIEAFDAENGKRVWQAKVNGEARGLAAADGHLVVSTTTGAVYCYSADRAEDAAISSEAVAKYVRDERYVTAASELIEQTGTTQGYCLVVGSERGQLAYELAKQTDLKVYCVEKDPEKVAWSREALADAGLYGWRVTVEQAAPGEYAFPNYFANLIVSETQLSSGVVPAAPESVARHLKPCGGKIFFGSPFEQDENQSAEWLQAVTELIENTEIAGDGRMLSRGKLPGAGEWTHQYGNPGSTSMAGGTRLHGGLSVLWYGDPGPSEMLNRHVGAVGPVSANGRLIQQGDETLMAYDAYNGQFLWEIDNAGAIRTGVFKNYEPGNLAVSDDHVFHVVNDECWQIDAATGDVLARHEVPASSTEQQWGYLAYANGRLFGTATNRDLIPEKKRRRGRTTHGVHSDTLFAIDINSQERLWTYRGHNILHTTVALSDDRVFFVDASLSQEQREQFLNQERSNLEGLTGGARQAAEEELKQKDLRLAVAVDAETGEQLWSVPVDVTDCSDIGTGGRSINLDLRQRAPCFGRSKCQWALLEAVFGGRVQAAASGRFGCNRRLEEVGQRRELPASTDRRGKSDHRRALGVRFVDRSSDNADASGHGRTNALEVHSTWTSLRDVDCHGVDVVLPLKIHGLLRPER